MTAKSQRKPAPLTDDVPFTARLPDGRTLFVQVPAKWCERDVTGQVLFKPEAVRFMDRVQALAMKTPAAPTPGYIKTLRQALGLTQQQFGDRVGVDKMTVWRWEQGQLHPGEASAQAIETLRRQATRKGVLLAG